VLQTQLRERAALVTTKTRSSHIVRAGMWTILSHPETAADALTEFA
jgi:hypothetical protein